MKYRFLLAIVLTLLIPSANAAPSLKVTPATNSISIPLGVNDEISKSYFANDGTTLVGTLASGSSQTLVSGAGLGGTDGFIAKISLDGKLIWGLRLGSEFEDVATSLITDSANTYWVLGASESVVTLTNIETTTVIINPDSVTVIKENKKHLGQLVTNIWHISQTGELLGTIKSLSETPITPRDLALSSDGLIIASDLMITSGRIGLFSKCSFAGSCDTLSRVGVKNTSLRAILRNKDGTYFAVGKSADSILKTKLSGSIDGVILTLTSRGVIKSVVRSSLAKTLRTWESASDTYLLGGFAVSGKTSEASITQFSQSAKPIWSMRIPSATTALTAGHSAIFASKGLIPTLSNWKPKTASVIYLNFDGKGVIKEARAIVGAVNPVSISYLKGVGYSIITQNVVESGYSVTFVASSGN